MIDDEVDNASINTNPDEDTSTRINTLIRVHFAYLTKVDMSCPKIGLHLSMKKWLKSKPKR